MTVAVDGGQWWWFNPVLIAVVVFVESVDGGLGVNPPPQKKYTGPAGVFFPLVPGRQGAGLFHDKPFVPL